MRRFRRLPAAERKLQIRTAAKTVFLQKGFKKTTMEDVVAMSGMSKGGVYSYYKSTAAMLGDIMIDGMNFRLDLVTDYITLHQDLSRDDLIIELLLDKLFDSNEFKSLYAMFLLELKHNEKLQNLYDKIVEHTSEMFVTFVKKHNLDILASFNTKIFIAVIDSVILGTEILDTREVFLQHRDAIRKLLKYYMHELSQKSAE